MTFSPNKVIMREQRSQKNRGCKSFNIIRFKFGDSALIAGQQCNFETRYFHFVKKFFKKISKKIMGYRYNFRRKCWIPIFPNFPLTKKSKNSRMGKGKGFFVRWIVRLQAGNKILETKHVSSYRLVCLRCLLQKHLGIKILLFFSKPKSFVVHFSLKKNFFWIIN